MKTLLSSKGGPLRTPLLHKNMLGPPLGGAPSPAAQHVPHPATSARVLTHPRARNSHRPAAHAHLPARSHPRARPSCDVPPVALPRPLLFLRPCPRPAPPFFAGGLSAPSAGRLTAGLAAAAALGAIGFGETSIGDQQGSSSYQFSMRSKQIPW